MPANPPAINSFTVLLVWSGSPKPAPASAKTGIVTDKATCDAISTCSVSVNNGSVIALEAPETYPPT